MDAQFEELYIRETLFMVGCGICGKRCVLINLQIP